MSGVVCVCVFVSLLFLCSEAKQQTKLSTHFNYTSLHTFRIEHMVDWTEAQQLNVRAHAMTCDPYRQYTRHNLRTQTHTHWELCRKQMMYIFVCCACKRTMIAKWWRMWRRKARCVGFWEDDIMIEYWVFINSVRAFIVYWSQGLNINYYNKY